MILIFRVIKMDSNNYIVQVQDLYYRYDKENVLENINLSIQKGSFLAIVGPNGSGKSTLLRLMLGLIKPQQGSIRLFGQDIGKFKEQHKIGFVSQKANSFNTGFPATVFEVVASGLTKKLGLYNFLKKSDHAKIKQTIDSVGMGKFLDRNIGELSGGQQQRVFIARALVSEPELLILDEPTVGVDVQNVNSFYEMLETLNKEKGITLLLVTHDIGTISEKVTNVACLNKNMHFHGSAEEFEQLKINDVSEIYGHDVHVLTHDHHHHGGGHLHD